MPGAWCQERAPAARREWGVAERGVMGGDSGEASGPLGLRLWALPEPPPASALVLGPPVIILFVNCSTMSMVWSSPASTPWFS